MPDLNHPQNASASCVDAAAEVRRGGFTTVELLVVIGIMVLLVGIVAVGMSGALSGTIDRSTETRLETLATMMSNYARPDANNETQQLPEMLRAIPGGGSPTYSTVDDGPDATAGANSDPIAAPTTADPSGGITEPAFARTQAVLRRLLTVPANADLYASLPDDAKTRPLNNTGSLLNPPTGGSVSPPVVLDPPLMLDGHGQVILYVPPAGMAGLKFEDGRSGVTVRAADGRAFWASAGADGNFGATSGSDGTPGNADDEPRADDNVYSTQVVFE